MPSIIKLSIVHLVTDTTNPPVEAAFPLEARKRFFAGVLHPTLVMTWLSLSDEGTLYFLPMKDGPYFKPYDERVFQRHCRATLEEGELKFRLRTGLTLTKATFTGLVLELVDTRNPASLRFLLVLQ